MSTVVDYGLTLQQVEGSGTSRVGRGEGLECDATVVTTNTSITVKRSNVSQFGAMANEQPWTFFVEDFIARNSEILEILERGDTNLTFAVAVVRGGYQGIDPPTNEEIIRYYRDTRPPADVAIAPAQPNDEDSNMVVDSFSSLSGPSFASLDHSALEPNDGNGAPDDGRFPWPQNEHDHPEDGNGAPGARFAWAQNEHDQANRQDGNGAQELVFDPDNDDGDTSVGRLNPNPIPVVSQNAHTVTALNAPISQTHPPSQPRDQKLLCAQS
jgi:hypothetical protein